MIHDYRSLESLEPFDDDEELVKAIKKRDDHIYKLEKFIEQDNDIKDAFEAWEKDWWEVPSPVEAEEGDNVDKVIETAPGEECFPGCTDEETKAFIEGERKMAELHLQMLRTKDD